MATTYADPRRWWALAALGLAVLTLGFDITIMNVALPTIATELEVGTDGLQWMVNAYVLVIAGLMLTCGALGDRYGRKRLLLIGLGLFGISSAIAAGVDSAALVIAARGVMGMGAAIVMPVAFAVLAALFGPAERGKAVSLLVMGLGIGIPLGPIIGGYLLEHSWWGSIFLINVPIAILGAVAIAVLLPESRDPLPRRPDVLGALLSTTGLTSLVYGVIEARVLVQPACGVLGGGEVVGLVAEGGADRGDLLRVDQRDHSVGGLDAGEANSRVEGDPDRVAAGRRDRIHASHAPEQGREHQGVEGAPGVELLAGHGESVRGGSQREALPDDSALVVVLGVRYGCQTRAYVIDRAPGGRGELLEGDGVAVDEQPQERDQQPGVEAGLLGLAESLG